jgi:hypothetical protein
MRRPGTQSYHNDVEVRVAAQAVQALVRLGVSPIDIGVISLCKRHTLFVTFLTHFYLHNDTDKEQADKIEAHLKGMSQSVFGSVQVSTVDAFQVFFQFLLYLPLRANTWRTHLSILIVGSGEASYYSLYSENEPK